MKKEELFSLLASIGISPSKKLGQNFLMDGNLLDFIVRTAALSKDQHILEIGPGLGFLTDRLLAEEVSLTAVEYDAKIASYLNDKYDKKIKLVHQDACKIDLDELMKNGSCFRIVSNLPYAISTPLLSKITGLKNPPEEMVLLLQKETALRFISKPKTKDYSAISVKIQAIYNTEYIRSVPPDVFYPKPEVTSGIVKFTKKQNIPDLETREKLAILTRTAFLKRRKKLINTIKDIMPENISEIFKQLNINENARPEELPPEIYLKMTKHVQLTQFNGRLRKI